MALINRSNGILWLAAGALLLKWAILPEMLPAMQGPQEYLLSAPVSRDVGPPNVAYGSPDARQLVTAWLAPDCPYCRVWWKQNFQAFDNADVKTGQVELIVRPFPETQRDIYVEQFLACLPNNDARQTAFNEFMTTSAWMSAPIGSWPSVGLLNQSCMSNAKARTGLLDRAKRDEAMYHIKGTPSFAVGQEMMVGKLSWATLPIPAY